MTNSYKKLIESIAKKDWTKASEVFSNIMQSKVAIRLTEERRKIGALAVNEQTADEK